jgi:hypothetical protein
MDESLAWQARYDELRSALRRIGATLGDRDAAQAQRDAAAQEFVATWQAITRHIKRQPTVAPAVPPGT